MQRKGVYPYQYMDSLERFEEISLPAKDAFHSKLNIEGINDKDYDHAQKVWNIITPKGDKKTLGDYHDLYLATDVLLLADDFENFQNMCLEHYQQDPAHFYTAPELAWTIALKLTKMKLELLTDIDMLFMFEKGKRGGIAQPSHRYAKTNNE